MTDAAIPDWRHEAACRGEDPDLFFPLGNTGPAVLQIEDAKAVCRRCGVTDTCLRWALDTGQEAGVWGGLSEDERKSLKRRRARARAAAAAAGDVPDEPQVQVPSPHQVLKQVTGRSDPREGRRLEPDHNVSVPAATARRLIELAYEAGLDRVRVANRVGVAVKWVSSVTSGAKPQISLAYERRVLAALAEYAAPGTMPAAVDAEAVG